MNKHKTVVFLDLDGPLADFDAAVSGGRNLGGDPPEMFVRGFFRNLPVTPGARTAVQTLLGMPHLAVYIGTKFSNKNVDSATEKLEWLREHFPELARHCMLSCDKGLLHGDFLVDDDRKWEHQFRGQFVYFDTAAPEQSWRDILSYFESANRLLTTGNLANRHMAALANNELLQKCVSAADDLRTHWQTVQEDGGTSAFAARLKHFDAIRSQLLNLGL